MTDEEIIKRVADDHSHYLDYFEDCFNEFLNVAINVIQWKDLQFKEYLEKKLNEQKEVFSKEAIKAAKEWLKNTDNFYQGGSEEYPDVITMYNTIKEMVADFEANMNKLLEETK